MKKGVLALGAMVGVAFNAPAHAGYWMSGNKLYDWCRGVGQAHDVCTSFVMGVIDGDNSLVELLNSMPRLKNDPVPPPACVPANVTARQMADVVRDHPADRADVASSLVIEALFEAFPCNGSH